MICTSSQNSDKPGHPPSLIRVFSVHMRNPGVLGYRSSALQRLIGPARYPGWSSLCRMLRTFCWLCHAQAHILCVICNNCGDNIEPRLDKTNEVAARPAKTQISLGIRPVWSESSLALNGQLRTQAFFMRTSPTLIWVFAGRTVILLVLSWGSSFNDNKAQGKLLSPYLSTLPHKVRVSQFWDHFTITRLYLENKLILPLLKTPHDYLFYR